MGWQGYGEQQPGARDSGQYRSFPIARAYTGRITLPLAGCGVGWLNRPLDMEHRRPSARFSHDGVRFGASTQNAAQMAPKQGITRIFRVNRCWHRDCNNIRESNFGQCWPPLRCLNALLGHLQMVGTMASSGLQPRDAFFLPFFRETTRYYIMVQIPEDHMTKTIDPLADVAVEGQSRRDFLKKSVLAAGAGLLGG